MKTKSKKKEEENLKLVILYMNKKFDFSLAMSG